MRPAFSAFISFNRTIEELKSAQCGASKQMDIAFNRTIEELKWRLQDRYRSGMQAFNRTIEELKYRGDKAAAHIKELLIAP